MDQVALRLAGTSEWTWIGGTADAKKLPEVIVRAFDREIEFATGEGRDGPTSEPLRVPPGEGRRLAGRHFFVRPRHAGTACRVTYRGLDA